MGQHFSNASCCTIILDVVMAAIIAACSMQKLHATIAHHTAITAQKLRVMTAHETTA